MPNSVGEINLEKQYKKNIWEDYAGDFIYMKRKPLSYSAFVKLWQDCFPHVKIRTFKQVSG